MNQLIKTCYTIAIFVLISSLSLQAQETRPKMPAPKADVYIVPKPQNLPVTLQYPGDITSFKSVQVVARVLGVLEKKYFTEGQKVAKGALLYKIEDSTYKASVDAAAASVQVAQATLDNAQRNWNRVKRLYKSKAVSQATRDSSLAVYEEAKATLAEAKAKLETAKINLNYTDVKAPIDGVVGIKKVDVGNLVSSNPPTPLVDITQNSKVYVNFSMPMSDYIKIKNHIWSIPDDGKIAVGLEVDNKPIKEKGVVDFIDVNINKDTSTVRMRAVFDNANDYLMAGQFVKVNLEGIVEKNVITVPQQAVLQNPLGTIVFVVQKGHVGVRPVVVGDPSGDNFIVKNHLLKTGDEVIVNNFFRLKPGSEVAVDKIINKQGK